MSDLISRSELIKALDKYCGSQRYLVSENIREIINNQPTAYSIDKVVEGLESLKDGYDHSCIDDAYQRGVKDGAKWLKKKAIEIVKQGGIRKDVEQLETTGLVRRFDDIGRINIPKEIRIKLFGTKCTDGQPMEIFVDKDKIILRKHEESISDDVCEWELEDEEANLYLTECQQRQLIFEGTPKGNGYRYCSYCGKKIKVVEQ